MVRRILVIAEVIEVVEVQARGLDSTIIIISLRDYQVGAMGCANSAQKLMLHILLCKQRLLHLLAVQVRIIELGIRD
jgi:hypothetical protein